MKYLFRDSKGFTLLEVTVAMTVFLVGVMAVFPLFPQGVMSLQRTSKDVYLVMIAQSLRNGIRDAYVREGKEYFTDQFWKQHAHYAIDNSLVQEGLFVLDPLDVGFKEKPLMAIDYEAAFEDVQGELVLKVKLIDRASYEHVYTVESYI